MKQERCDVSIVCGLKKARESPRRKRGEKSGEKGLIVVDGAKKDELRAERKMSIVISVKRFDRNGVFPLMQY